jgi:hypothetical protein
MITFSLLLKTIGLQLRSLGKGLSQTEHRGPHPPLVLGFHLPFLLLSLAGKSSELSGNLRQVSETMAGGETGWLLGGAQRTLRVWLANSIGQWR